MSCIFLMSLKFLLKTAISQLSSFFLNLLHLFHNSLSPRLIIYCNLICGVEFKHNIPLLYCQIKVLFLKIFNALFETYADYLIPLLPAYRQEPVSVLIGRDQLLHHSKFIYCLAVLFCFKECNAFLVMFQRKRLRAYNNFAFYRFFFFLRIGPSFFCGLKPLPNRLICRGEFKGSSVFPCRRRIKACLFIFLGHSSMFLCQP